MKWVLKDRWIAYIPVDWQWQNQPPYENKEACAFEKNVGAFILQQDFLH